MLEKRPDADGALLFCLTDSLPAAGGGSNFRTARVFDQL